jgi:phospholipase/carboxylesterase
MLWVPINEVEGSEEEGCETRAWFDVLDQNPHTIATEGYKRSVNWVTKLIQAEIRRGIPSDRILLAGFSQGGMIALRAGLHFDQRLLGIVALGSYLPQGREFDKLLGKLPDTQLETPIFLGIGRDDQFYEKAEKSRDILRDRNHIVEWFEFDGEHELNSEELKQLGLWISDHILSRLI